MGQYRKKPVVIEAIQWDPSTMSHNDLKEFCGENVDIFNGIVIITTLEGALEASPKDWIIRGIKGEIYPCKPEIFELTYEEVELKKDWVFEGE